MQNAGRFKYGLQALPFAMTSFSAKMLTRIYMGDNHVVKCACDSASALRENFSYTERIMQRKHLALYDTQGANLSVFSTRLLFA